MKKRNRKSKGTVIVLGMHRSGTSLITKSLELLGVNLGAHLYQARADNPKGFWEDIDVVGINDSLLSKCGASWSRFVFNPLVDLSEQDLSELMARAVELLHSRASEFGLWGFKDPRCCRLIPFWKQALASAGLLPLFLVITRNPLSVAASLAARDKLSPAKCGYLWAQHTFPSLKDTYGYKRAIVDYDIFLSEPFEHIRRIAAALDLPAPSQDSPIVKDYLDEFISKDLRHTTYSMEDLRASSELASDITSLYELAVRGARGEVSIDSPDFAAELESIGKSLESISPALLLINESEQKLDTVRQESDSLRGKISTLERSCTTLQGQHEELSKGKDALTRQLTETEQALQSLRNSHLTLQNTCIGLQNQTIEFLKERELLSNDSRSKEETILSLRKSCSDFESASLELSKEIDRLAKESQDNKLTIETLESSRARLEDLTTELSQERDRLAQETQENKQTIQTLESSRARLEDLTTELSQERDRLAERIHEKDQALAAFQKSCVALEVQTAETSRTNSLLEKEVSDRESALKSLENSYCELETQAAKISRENTTLEKELSDTAHALKSLENSYCELETQAAKISQEKSTVEDELSDTKSALKSVENRFCDVERQVTQLTEERTRNLDHVRSLNEAIAAAHARISIQDGELAETREALKLLRAEETNLTSVVHEQTASIASLRGEREALNRRIDTLQGTIRDVTSSKSWKVTAPLRGFMMLTKNTLHFILRIPRRTALWLWRRTPITREMKDTVRDRIFCTIPRLFENTERYKTWKNNRLPVLPSMSTRPASDRTVADSFVAHSIDPQFQAPKTRLIAFYLPQFHPIPENNAWWGEGFTEWTNVRPAKPQFEGHYQPHTPLDLGYYDLLDGQTQRKQVELAKQYGIGGFCFYMYWFGGKRLLEKPLDRYVADKSLDLPFCVCWANENWSRRWDGLEQELLISQKHSPEDDIAFIACALQYLADPRYIRVNGRPLLIVYRPSLFPNIQETVLRWRTYCRENGIGEIHLAYTQSFEAVDPAKYGFDSAIEFPPNNASPPKLSDKVKPTHDAFASTVYDWRYYAKRSESYIEPPYSLFRSVCPSWDNTARRKEKGTVFLHSSPPAYQIWLENAICHTRSHRTNPEEQIIFINAWNEWAEGAHLEPDEKYGYAWLAATRLALSNRNRETSRAILLTTHDCYAHGAQIQTLETARTFKKMGFSVYTLTLRGGPLLEEFCALGPTLHCGGSSEEELNTFLRSVRAEGGHEAVTSTIVSGALIPKLKEHGFKVISLIHELPGIITQMGQHRNGELIAKYADKVVFPADFVCSKFREIFPLEESKIVVRPQGLLRRNPFKGHKNIAHEEVCSKYKLPKTSKIVVAVAYGDKRKGIDLFVEVAARVIQEDPRAVFLWIGSGERALLSAANRRIAELGLQGKVILPGFCDDPRIFFAAADVYALTSREDPFPNVVNEAFDVDVPVVGFENATGAASYILENNGALASFEDVQDFSDKVLKFLSGPSIECPKKVGSLRTYVLDLLHHLSGLPRVSVVVPNYNYQKYLEERIKSVVQQTFPVYELIVLDDCSTDGSVKIIEELARAIDVDTTVVVNETNSGSVFKQWRKGVDLSKGDMIWIAEADDLSDKSFLSTLLPRFQDPELTMAYCESKMMAPDGKITSNNYLSYTTGASKCFMHDYHRSGTQEIVDALCIKNTIPNVSAVLFRADALKRELTRHQSKIESLKVGGDWFLYLHLLCSGTISFCSHSLNMHRRHPSSVTSSLAKIRHLEEIAQMQKLASELVSIPENKRERAAAYLEEIRKYFGLSPRETAEVLQLQSNG